MSVKLYDDALIEKLKHWTEDTMCQIVGPEETRELFEIKADKNDDKPIKLPLISLIHRGGYTISNFNKRPLTFDGLMLDSTIPTSISLNAVPISIPYQLDIYTRYYEEADEYLRNFIFNIINFPRVQVIIPYNNIELAHDSNIRLSDSIIENSNVPVRLRYGQLTKLSLVLDIDDAYIFDAKIRDNYSIECNVKLD